MSLTYVEKYTSLASNAAAYFALRRESDKLLSGTFRGKLFEHIQLNLQSNKS